MKEKFYRDLPLSGLSLLTGFHGLVCEGEFTDPAEMMRRFLVISVLVHGGILLWSFWKAEHTPATLAAVDPFLLDWVEPQKQSSPQKSSQKNTKGSGRKGRHSSQSLSQLLHPPMGQRLASPDPTDDSALPYDSRPTLGGDAEFLQSSVELPKNIEAIWRQIRAHIHYHSDFFVKKLNGRVHARIRVDRDGKLEKMIWMDGDSRLAAWVKTSLSRALTEPFLRHPLPKKLILNLNFHFAIESSPSPVQPFEFNHLNLNFEILGYQNNLSQGYEGIKGLFVKRKMNKTSDWDFEQRAEQYSRACFAQDNIIGCQLLLQLREGIGEDSESKRIVSQMEEIKKKNPH